MPMAIVIAGVIIGVSLILAIGRKEASGPQLAKLDEAIKPEAPDIKNAKPVTATDHIFGDPQAPIKLVGFSDTECPACRKLHFTLHELLREYDGRVAWVYRHLPLDGVHEKSRKEAEATECATELGGNVKFWAYIDRLYEITPSNDDLNPAELPNIAAAVGLDVDKFKACLASDRLAARVEEQARDAVASGAQGTPFVVIVKNGEPIDTIAGALPLPAIKAKLDVF